MSFLQKVQASYKIVANKISEQEFYEKNKIDPEDMSYAGSGDFGEAYHVNDRILKKTTSASEFKIAKEIMRGNYPAFVEIYAVEEVDGKSTHHSYYILQEEVEIDSDIEDSLVRLTSMLETQELPIQYMSHFDEDDYIESEGDEVMDGKIDPELVEFMNELDDIVSDYRRLGIEASDINAGNLGRNKKGKLVAFDIDEKGQGHWS
jgi:hypothetical protein